MGEFTDSFHPNIQKRYSDFLNELDADHVYRGLLGYGMFANRLPRVLTSEIFLIFCMYNSISTPKKTWCPWISFRYTRDTGSYRNFGIPNPFVYNQLVELIKLNWVEIRKHLIKHSQVFPYVINSVHIRKLHQENAIFSMNYSNWEEDYDPIPAIAVGKKFAVHCDISQCFPSIYTHAVDWAIRGKKQAKSNHTGNSKQKTWPEKLDQALQSTTNGETHGVLIGPHSSNVVSEILLTPVDETLINKGFRFKRAIDDYTCFVDTYPEAEKLRLKKWCKAISLLPSNLHYATSLQTLKSLSITCMRWLMVSCVHDPLLGGSSKRRERLSMKCVATNHSSF